MGIFNPFRLLPSQLYGLIPSVCHGLIPIGWFLRLRWFLDIALENDGPRVSDSDYNTRLSRFCLSKLSISTPISHLLLES